MARTPLALAWVLVAASLAGCGKAAAPEAADPIGEAALAFEGETGIVRGTISDTDGLPVPGALVGLQGLTQVAADATGAFRFLNVPVGEHTLLAAALGYESGERQVTVALDQEVVADIALERMVLEEPYHETVTKAGHICMQLNVGGQTSGTGTTFNGGNAACGSAGSIFQSFDVEADLKTLVAEMQWTPTSGITAPELRLLIWQGGSRTGVFTCEFCYGEARGPSPVVLRIDEDVRIGEHNPFQGVDAANRTLEDVILTPPSQANPTMVNLVLDQRTTIYNSMFYGALAPADFTALP